MVTYKEGPGIDAENTKLFSAYAIVLHMDIIKI